MYSVECTLYSEHCKLCSVALGCEQYTSPWLAGVGPGAVCMSLLPSCAVQCTMYSSAVGNVHYCSVKCVMCTILVEGSVLYEVSSNINRIMGRTSALVGRHKYCTELNKALYQARESSMVPLRLLKVH